MRLPIFALAAAMFFTAIAHADPVVTDQAAAKRVLGRHAITLQWIGTGTLSDAGVAADYVDIYQR